MSKKSVIERMAYVINKEMYGDREFVASLYNVTTRTIANWKKGGLHFHKLASVPHKELFKLTEVQDWHSQNISQAKATSTAKAKNRDNPQAESEPNHNGDIHKMDYVALEKEEKKMKVQLAKVKLDEAEGRLVSAEDLDKALYEQAIMHVTKLSNDQKTLPVVLANKSQDEVKQLLTDHNSEHLDTLKANVQRKFKGDMSNYDVFNVILDLRKSGLSVDDIIGRLEK